MDVNCQNHPSFHLPDTMPVMVLGDCYLFPGCLLPLFIFEERYRLMLAHALKTDRMFCIGTRVRTAKDGYELLPVSTAGLIRACKKQEDGTSHVMLQGMRRIRFKNTHQEKPFVIADIEPMPTVIETEAGYVDELKDRALDLLPDATSCAGDAMRNLRTALLKIECPDLVCDILAYHFVRRPPIQHSLLIEPVLEKRYDILIAELERLQAED
ncbi:ATP-dependent Lon protease [Prosthecobacter fusiformis]|uniref:ATP-dependent Lon protease n=1 Tax=Prosthecobacter fusiformis TaxID=48464 RepID=A0A4R7SSA5_9BACT|nr:LON peptidase substrate-binding domain-containing protein [Prosthecobacter fusiformis]TDU81077.1 ATP-dependent Lon protease [Prosthecobacter fusiformis]